MVANMLRQIILNCLKLLEVPLSWTLQRAIETFRKNFKSTQTSAVNVRERS